MSGDDIEVNENLTVIVGPNNVGKSALLNALWQIISSSPNQPHYAPSPLVARVEAIAPSPDGIVEYLDSRFQRAAPGQYNYGLLSEEHFRVTGGQAIPVSRARELVQLRPLGPQLGELAPLLAINMPPEGRLGQLGYAGTPDLYSEVPSNPLQRLWADRSLEAKFAAYARRAFNMDITVNRHAGSQIGLHIGRPEAAEPQIGQSSKYREQVAALPLAQTQGHGVQAFLGIVLNLLSGEHDLIFVDEPEAFLHPPQARLLGEIFVELARGGSQIIVSTHSDDFLQGVLKKSGSRSDASVVRITRPEPGTNAVAQIDAPTIKRLYEDPLIRHSSILDGIFYKGTVFCEAEADCLYYSAVLDSVTGEDDPRADILFTHCGGKDRLAKGVAALRDARVPTAVVADVDLLADAAKFNQLFALMGGDVAAVTPLINTLTAWVNTQAVSIDRVVARLKLGEVLNGSAEDKLTADEIDRMRKALKATSGWDALKMSGRGGIAKGGVYTAFEQILTEAAAVGLFIVPVGELERFHPSVPGKNKQQWLRTVFETGVYDSSEESKELVRHVIGFITSMQ